MVMKHKLDEIDKYRLELLNFVFNHLGMTYFTIRRKSREGKDIFNYRGFLKAKTTISHKEVLDEFGFLTLNSKSFLKSQNFPNFPYTYHACG